jgi:hypothetical protein
MEETLMPWTHYVCNTIVGLHIGLVVFLGVSLPVHASLFVAMTAEELIEHSEAVIQGKVIAQRSHWDEQGKMVVTDTTVHVTDTIVGVPREFETVRTLGGSVGRFHVQAIGFPQLNKGEQVILFVQSSDGVSRIVGHQQGHFEVVERLDGVLLAVPRIEDGAGLFTLSGEFMPAPPSTGLDTFKQRVRAEATRLGRSTN